MKKIIKLSLVATLATMGMSALNAKPLTEAIKDVDVSGSVVYRYNDYKNDTTDSSSTNNYYKIGVNVSSKINDDFKFNSRVIAGGADLGLKALNTKTSGDGAVDVVLSHANFAYTGVKNTTVTIGKQGLTTPWTVAIDVDGNEHTGTGVLALSNWKTVTFAGAYFNQTNLDTSGNNKSSFSGASDLYTLGVIGNIGTITLDAWYADMAQDGAKLGFDTYTIGAKGNFKIDSVNLGFDTRYTNLSIDDANDNAAFELGLTAKAGIFNAQLQYVNTSDEGGLVAFDQHATTTFTAWNVNSHNKKDADLWMIRLGAQVIAPLHIALNYLTVDYVDGLADAKEETIYTQLTYKMSKNLSSYVRFGTYDKKVANKDINDDFRGRLQIHYSF